MSTFTAAPTPSGGGRGRSKEVESSRKRSRSTSRNGRRRKGMQGVSKKRKERRAASLPHATLLALAVASSEQLQPTQQGHALTKGEAGLFVRQIQQQIIWQLDQQHSGRTEKDIVTGAIETTADVMDVGKPMLVKLYSVFAANIAKQMGLLDEGVAPDVKKAVPDAAALLRLNRNEKAKKNGRTFAKIPRWQWPSMEKSAADLIQEGRSAVSISMIRQMWGAPPHNRTLDKKTVTAFLKKLGFEYSVADKTVRKLSPTRLGRIRRFCIEYCDALVKERAGTHVIVTMDESYCHQHHNCATWNKIDKQSGESTVEGAAGRGKRQIITHAITKHGLLVRWREAGDLAATAAPAPNAMEVDPPVATPPFDPAQKWVHKATDTPSVTRIDRELSVKPNQSYTFQRRESAELVFPAGRAKNKDGKFIGAATRGDYHDNFDGHVFMLWVEKRLTPAFEACFPGKLMILVLDNAKYHHGLVDDFVGVLDHHKPNRLQMYEWMDEFQLASIELTVSSESSKARRTRFKFKAGEAARTVTVHRVANGQVVKSKKKGTYKGKTFNTKKCNVSNKEMQAAIKKHVGTNYPHRMCTKIVKYFYTRHWILIWTPPYCPDVQPIEKLWAHTKNGVAKNYNGHMRTLPQLYDQIMTEFYGGPRENALMDAAPGFTPTNAANLFRHCLFTNFNKRLVRDPVLGEDDTENGTFGLHLTTRDELLTMWTEQGEAIKRIAVECDAFPDQRMWDSGDTGGVEEEEEVEEEDDETALVDL